MDGNPETFQHPQSGDAGKPQDYSQQSPGFLERVSPGLAWIFTMS